MTETAPVLAILNCPRCGHTLGTYDALHLYLGSAVIMRIVTLHCSLCGKTRIWQPAGSTMAAANVRMEGV